jgi:hypothetical protein
MLHKKRRDCAAAVAVLTLCLSSSASAQAPPANAPPQGKAQRTSGYLPAETSGKLAPPANKLSLVANNHPLKAVITYARKEQQYLQQYINDFTCRLVKRERIGGVLQDMQYIDMQVREHVTEGQQTLQPLSLYLNFLAPTMVAGRKVIYVEGQNDNKLLVRNGGRRFEYVVVDVDPNSPSAREETLVPVTDIGFSRLLAKMIDVLERHQQADPTGQNSKAEQVPGAKLNGRSCTVIRVTHPVQMKGLEFHRASVYVDDELHIPVRVDYADWPKQPGDKPPLIAEYTYTDLRLNVNLPASAFDRSRLRSGAQ